MHSKILILFIVLLVASCAAETEKENKQRTSGSKVEWRMVGDIQPDPLLDDPNFKLCGDENQLIQYYALNEKPYKGEQWAINKAFKQGYNLAKKEGENGLIRIRFVVNCKGETGRFRLLAMNPDYSERAFDQAITDRLLEITKSLDGWKVLENQKKGPLEYYQYLIFKMKDGQIMEILP